MGGVNSKKPQTKSSSMSSTKFRTCKKDTYSLNMEKFAKVDTEHFASNLMEYHKNYCTEVLQESTFTKNTIPTRNGFVDTVIFCYNYHHNLVIRPDDIWTAILIQFSFYVNGNSEKLRSKFVKFKGQKELRVDLKETLRNAPYDLFVTLMTEKIDDNLVDKEVKHWIMPSFTTTTKDDIMTCGAIFMATMKNYFTYTCTTFCGIPWITIEGSLEDWKDILNRAKKLKEYNLEKWYKALKPILKQFVNVKQGDIDLGFWRRICSNSITMESGRDYISGWITVFCTFDVDGLYIVGYRWPWNTWQNIDIKEIPSGICSAEVKISDISGTYDSVLLAGHMGCEFLPDDSTVKPKTGWAIVLKEKCDADNFFYTERIMDAYLPVL